jgi:hypothetical protein
MALVQVGSIGLRDYTGGKKARKTLPVYVDNSLTLANIQTLFDSFLPDLDAAIDPIIEDASINLQLTLPGGLKSTAGTGTTVHEGALLHFDAANTNYVFDPYVPGWKQAGFSGDTVLNTGVYATLIGDFISLSIVDKQGNALSTFENGSRVFRK